MVGQSVGKYNVLSRIGRGGMGTVYRAHDEILDRDVAIKILNPELSDPDLVRRFRAEAVTVARLNDAGIAAVYELLQHDGQWLMVMEYVRGETLEQIVERAGALAPERAADLCEQALIALGHAHRMGVIHRDLKPANLMMTESGAIKVMDFGIAKVSGGSSLTQPGLMMGTPAYMAPEQVLGGEVDARADLYAMGVILYRLVTGKLPFKGDTPFAIAQSQVKDPPTPIRLARESVPVWLEAVTAKALAKSPAHRFQTAEEFCQALRRGISGYPIEAATTAGGATHTSALTSAGTIPSLPFTGAQAVPAAAESPAGPRTITLQKRSVAAVGIGGVSLVVLLIAVLAYVSLTRRASMPEPVVATTSPAAAASQQPSPSAQQPSQQASSPAAPPQQTSPPALKASPAAPATKLPSPPESPAVTQPPASTTSAAPHGRDALVRDTTPPGAGSAAPAPTAPADSPVAFVDVKILLLKGTKTDDQDVVLNLAASQISVVPKKGGAALRSIPYSRLKHATYTHARDPQWDESLTGPPPKLDLPGVFKSARHWLTLQTGDGYLILRLEDSNWVDILRTIETRTGVAVERRPERRQ